MKEHCEYCGKLLNKHKEVVVGKERYMALCTKCFNHLWPTQKQQDRLYARGEHIRRRVK